MATRKKKSDRTIGIWIWQHAKSVRNRYRSFMSRRPHRSFRVTRRRDYVRSLKLPGYIAFTAEVWRTLWQHKLTFAGLIAVYFILMLLLAGVTSQDTYQDFADIISESSQEADLGAFMETSFIFLGAVSSNFSASGASTPAGKSQQIFSGLLLLMTWLTTVWLLRNIMAGKRVKLRDGVYNAGAPIVPTFLLVLLAVVQVIPLSAGLLVYGAAEGSDLLDGFVALMLFWSVAALLATLSLYWMTSTALALVIVTLPGVYPLHAHRIASDIVIGRRVRILLRLLWALLITAIGWALVLIPMIALAGALQSSFSFLSQIPIVPLTVSLVGTISVVWLSSYVYLLYRRVVDDDAQSA